MPPSLTNSTKLYTFANYLAPLHSAALQPNDKHNGHGAGPLTFQKEKEGKMSQISRQQRRQFLDEKLSCKGSSIPQSNLVVGFIFSIFY